MPENVTDDIEVELSSGRGRGHKVVLSLMRAFNWMPER